MAIAGSPVDAFVYAKIEAGAIPGAVVVVGSERGIVTEKAFGLRVLGPEPQPMTVDTLFDLASVTKPIAGGSALLKAAELTTLSSRDTVRVAGTDIGLRHLATHTSGLPPVVDVEPILATGAPSPDAVYFQVVRTSLWHRPGAAVTYSDLGYLVLGRAVEDAVETDLESFLQARVFAPLGMADTTFRPTVEQRERRAPTYPPGSPLLGSTHNRMVRAYLTDIRVPGHAGLYSTGSDLARYAVMMLNDGLGDKGRVFAESSVDAMTTEVDDTGMTIGWTVWPAPDGSHAVGKIGWLGTFIWVHPGAGLFVVYLTNRTHLRDADDVWAPDYDGLLEVVWAAREEERRQDPKTLPP